MYSTCTTHVYTAYHTTYSICISAYSTPTRYSVTCHVTHTHVYHVCIHLYNTSYICVMCNGITQYYNTYICNGMYIHTTRCMCMCMCMYVYMYYYTLHTYVVYYVSYYTQHSMCCLLYTSPSPRDS